MTAFTLDGGKESIAIGTKAPKAKMKLEATDGKVMSLEDVAGANGLLVVFSCNTCPFVVGSSRGTEGWEGRYQQLYKEASKRRVGMVLINSNEAKRDNGDSMDDMIARQKEQGFTNIPYVMDQRHVIADAFGAKTTPHCFLFNSDMELVYKGAIDDNVDSKDNVTATWLIDAMDASTRGQKIDPNTTKAVGCSIKRVS
ncbi:MAG: redoxin domain-containing protein [Flavobacteriales bacterium]|nr:redoxin domain-containing protein [Flavobacteriales bacterium]